MSSATGFEALKQTIESALSASLPDSSPIAPQLLQAMRYALLGGGKRLRPMFTCVVGEALGAPLSPLLTVGCAVEMVHAYSLVHDDLPAMDNDVLRHGKPTVHVEYGEWLAILAGDALLTLAFETIGGLQDVPATVIASCTTRLARASGWAGMVGGQTCDMAFTGGTASPANLAALQALHAAKTGALICASVELGAVVAGADANTINGLQRFSGDVGLAFQITDDVLDVTASTDQLGKPAGSDIREQKQTFVTHLGVEGAEREAERLLERALAELDLLQLSDRRLHTLATMAVRRAF